MPRAHFLHSHCLSSPYPMSLWGEPMKWRLLLSHTHTQPCLSAHSRSAENHCWTTAVRSPSWAESSTALCSRKSCKVLTRWSSGYIILWSSGLSPGMWTYAYRGQIWEIIKVRTIRFSESKKSKILLLGQGDILFLYCLSWKQTLLLLLLRQACSLPMSLRIPG